MIEFIGNEVLLLKYGINLACFDDINELPIELQASLMKDNGFEYTFAFSSNGSANEKNASLLLKYGIKFDTLHAPFGGINNMWKSGEEGDEMLSRLIDGVDKCVIVGAETLIVHLSSGIPAPRINDIGFSRYDKLMEHARKKNIKIAYENQRFVANIAAVLEAYPEAGFCWDVGHENCFTPDKRFMPIFGERVCALHLHDNNRIFNKDEHLIPFDGKADYNYIAKTIAQSGYTGTLMLEVLRCNSHHYDKLTAEEYYSRAGKAVRKLDKLKNQYR